MRSVRLKPGRAKPLWHGHPWVYADSIQAVEDDSSAAAADWVRVLDADGKLIGRGLHSEQSTIRVRLLEHGADTERPLESILDDRIRGAARLRARLFPDPARTDAYRLVHSEGDGLPGLVVDRYGDVLVAQFATRPMFDRRSRLAESLLAASGARSLVARAAGHEGSEGIERDAAPFVVGEPVPDRVLIREAGLTLEAAPAQGQKTGHYTDQRENRVRVGALTRGLTVLDLFAGTGGFALQALAHGARACLAVDRSAAAAAAAGRNAERNGVVTAFEMRQAEVEPTLAELRAADRRFGLVVLDPPNFFPRGGRDAAARKAYRELNVRALTRVEPGGFLATFSCSPRLDAGALLALVTSAARECRRTLRVLHTLSAGPDHPVVPSAPMSRYLSGYVLQVEPW